MTRYAAFTFAPVQGFIEKSRKLRDLFGSSLILSYLSSQVVNAGISKKLDVISPGTPNVQKGMPNRILFAGEFTAAEEEQIRQELQQHFFKQWKRILCECRKWVEDKLQNDYSQWQWGEEWTHWGNHAWELFWGFGDSIKAAMESLEESKLDRNWTGINWVGRGSSLSGADSIAWPKLGDKAQYAPGYNFSRESEEIGKFYGKLAEILDRKSSKKNNEGESSENGQEETEEETPEGKFIDPKEKLSVPEMTKRLVTFNQIAKRIGMPTLKTFTDLERRPEDTGAKGQWTGWFMGDGDKVGNYLKSLSEEQDGEEKIKTLSNEMRTWGNHFSDQFPHNLGRVVYAGGDDFFGVIYNRKFSKQNCKAISGREILDWLIDLPDEWEKGKTEITNKNVTLSVGFVWAAPSVPLRDVLQHCREAERQSKNKGRDRITIRVLFNSGQYVEWTTPWKYLHILKQYEDLDGNRNDKANWSHVYQDLAHLKSRHAFGLDFELIKETVEKSQIKTLREFQAGILEFVDIYFPTNQNKVKEHIAEIVVDNQLRDINKVPALIEWIDNMISVGWHLMSD